MNASKLSPKDSFKNFNPLFIDGNLTLHLPKRISFMTASSALNFEKVSNGILKTSLKFAGVNNVRFLLSLFNLSLTYLYLISFLKAFSFDFIS